MTDPAGEPAPFMQNFLSLLVAAVWGSVLYRILTSSLTCFQQALQSLCQYPLGLGKQGEFRFPFFFTVSALPLDTSAFCTVASSTGLYPTASPPWLSR